MANCNCNNRHTGPCRPAQANTAECETIASQIDNFTQSFFGSITKTEVNGVVSWVLPCNLETGLPNNTRLPDEGLACYFLRLFAEGIVGLTGPAGATGSDGQNGFNAFTVTLQSFSQPSLDNPSLQIQTLYNPAIVQDITIFIQGSGWYNVDAADLNGFLYLSLRKAVDGAPSTIPIGRLVIPAGYAGESITGPTGPQGPKGDQGDPGTAFTESNGQYKASIGSDYALQATSTAVNFINSAPTLLLPTAGTYLLTATIPILGLTGILTNDIVTAKLYNETNNSDVAGSEQKISYIGEGQNAQIVISVLYTTDGNNQQVALYGDCTTSDKASVIALRTVLTYVRLD